MEDNVTEEEVVTEEEAVADSGSDAPVGHSDPDGDTVTFYRASGNPIEIANNAANIAHAEAQGWTREKPE